MCAVARAISDDDADDTQEKEAQETISWTGEKQSFASYPKWDIL